MLSDTAANFAKLLSWQSFHDTIENGFKTLSIPHRENSTFFQDFVSFHGQTDPLVFALILGLFFSFLSWVLSLITGLHTWVDKWWSITPVVYSLHFATHDCLHRSSGSPSPCSIRLWISAVLICIWGARLSYNFNRKGGYSLGFVDYRWTFLQTKISSAVFFIFNIVFICLYQNILLVLLAVPLYVVQQASHIQETSFNWIDVTATFGFIVCLALEYIADNQQWDFYEQRRITIAKRERLTGDLKRGFLSHGLFRYSRHANFFGEMGIWWFVYLYSVASTYPIYFQWVNPTILGAIILTSLFQGSTPLTEYLSSLKYPTYKQYQKTTSRLIPLYPGRPLDDFEAKTK